MRNRKEALDSWLFWLEARAWARDAHPSWEYMATQEKRPELREEYRKKIMEAYLEQQETFGEAYFRRENKV